MLNICFQYYHQFNVRRTENFQQSLIEDLCNKIRKAKYVFCLGTHISDLTLNLLNPFINEENTQFCANKFKPEGRRATKIYSGEEDRLFDDCNKALE
jgi:hypothetical protein